MHSTTHMGPQELGLCAVRRTASDVGERSASRAELRVADYVGSTQVAGYDIPRVEGGEREIQQGHSGPSVAGKGVASKVEVPLRLLLKSNSIVGVTCDCARQTAHGRVIAHQNPEPLIVLNGGVPDNDVSSGIQNYAVAVPLHADTEGVRRTAVAQLRYRDLIRFIVRVISWQTVR